MSNLVEANTTRIGKVSRACTLDMMPSFVFFGGVIPLERSSVPTREAGGFYEAFSAAEKKNFWLLESFTTYFVPLVEFPDVSKSQYHLRVNAIAWWRLTNAGTLDPQPGAPDFVYSTYESGWQSKWTLSQLRPLPFAYIFFRARAGGGSWPYFFQRPFAPGFATFGGDVTSVAFKIRGEHWYKDGNNSNPLPVSIGYSRATNDCNFQNWGWFWETP